MAFMPYVAKFWSMYLKFQTSELSNLTKKANTFSPIPLMIKYFITRRIFWPLQIAMRVGTQVEDVKNIIIWGNHSSTQYPDVNHGTVNMPQGCISIREAVSDDSFLNGEFITVSSLTL